jgi:hypothetical protein
MSAVARGVEVVHGDGAGLDVGADAHGLGGTDEHGDGAVTTGGEQVGLGLVGLGDACSGSHRPRPLRTSSDFSSYAFQPSPAGVDTSQNTSWSAPGAA